MPNSSINRIINEIVIRKKVGCREIKLWQNIHMEKIDLIVDLSSLMVNEQGNYEILVEPSAKQKFIVGSVLVVGNQYENWSGMILEKKYIEQGLYLIIKQKY